MTFEFDFRFQFEIKTTKQNNPFLNDHEKLQRSVPPTSFTGAFFMSCYRMFERNLWTNQALVSAVSFDDGFHKSVVDGGGETC